MNSLKKKKKVCGGKDPSGEDLSVMQPAWTPQSELMYIGDQSNWWNLYLVGNYGHRNLHPVSMEIGGPQWQFGRQNYDLDPLAVLDQGGLLIATTFKGVCLNNLDLFPLF